jgi:RNA polymerase sigma-70 factor (ECF subfamily)
MSRDRDARPGRDPVQADAALVARVGSGDSAACRSLMEAHLGRVHAYAWHMLGDPGEAEDVAQEAFLRLWRQAGNWRAEARVGTWLHRVVHNLCIDRLRRRRSNTGEEPPDLPDPAIGPAGVRQRAQVARAVEAAIRRLPERQRDAIALVHYQELGNIEAANIMGISVEALESLLARGRRSLRTALRGMQDDLMGEM